MLSRMWSEELLQLDEHHPEHCIIFVRGCVWRWIQGVKVGTIYLEWLRLRRYALKFSLWKTQHGATDFISTHNDVIHRGCAASCAHLCTISMKLLYVERWICKAVSYTYIHVLYSCPVRKLGWSERQPHIINHDIQWVCLYLEHAHTC